MCSRSRNTPTPMTPYVLIGSTLTAKSRSRFSLNSAARRWRSRRTTTNRADPSIAARSDCPNPVKQYRMDHWVEVKHRSRLQKSYSWKIHHAGAMVRIDGERAAANFGGSQLLTVAIQVRERE